MKAKSMKGMKKASMKKTASKSKAVMKKSMKTSMKKKKSVSVIAKGVRSRYAVFAGKKEKTATGMKKTDLLKNKSGKIVSKKRSALSKQKFASSALKKWSDACKKARKELGLSGFVAIGGKTPTGKALYAKIKSLLN